jgi:hypothetical protein
MDGLDLDGIAARARERFLRELAARPALRTLVYTFDMPLAGDGWHPRERKGARHWRFTGPGDRATMLFAPLAPAVRTLTLAVHHALTAAHAEHVRAELNGVPLEHRRWDGRTLAFTIPTGAVATLPYTRLELVTLPAIQSGGEDERRLGIAFSALTIQ